MNTPINGQKYLEHMAGLVNFLEWMIVTEKEGYSFEYAQNQIIFSPHITNRFLLGVPTDKKISRHPFLAVQKRESIFFQLLNITRVVIRDQEPYLHLIVSGLQGDQVEYPDLPPFVLSLAVDNPDKVAIMAQASHLECRGFWIDAHGEIEIGNKSVIWSKPLFKQPKDFILLEDTSLNGPSFTDILRIKLNATNRYESF